MTVPCSCRFVLCAISTAAITAIAATTGCSDPLPPLAAAALSVSFSDPPVSGKCPVRSPIPPQTVHASVGTISEVSRSVITDGDDGLTISRCGVVRQDEGFRVFASLVQRHLQFNLASVRVGEGQPNEGRVTLTNELTINTYTTPEESLCQFSVISVQLGSIWASFTCPLLRVETSTEPGCSAKGIVALENCES